MTRTEECNAAIAVLQAEQLRYPVGSVQRAQLQARIDALNVEKSR